MLKEAERLVKEYSTARLVVTSRIHCALPCIGMGTPVIYTENAQQTEASACRFGGLKELFNVFLWDKGKLKSLFDWNSKIDKTSNVPHNKNIWKPLADAMILRCSDFIGE